MMLVLSPIGRNIDVDTFTDITATPVVSPPQWVDGGVSVEFAANLTDTELLQVRVRAATRDAAAELLMRQAWAAYQSNATFLALPAPTTAQALAQVAALTRQTQGIIRLLIPGD